MKSSVSPIIKYTISYHNMSIPDRDLPLAKKIEEYYKEFGKTYGYRRLHLWLERQGIYYNPKTILKVMNKYNLLSVVRHNKYRNYGDCIHRYPNLLNRKLNTDKPNKKWVTDISYIKTAQGTLYLSIIRDLYNNSIIAYKIGTTQNINFVLSTIRASKKRDPKVSLNAKREG